MGYASMLGYFYAATEGGITAHGDTPIQLKIAVKMQQQGLQH